MNKLLILTAITLMMISTKSNAFYYTVNIQGLPISCQASNGQQVKFYTHPQAALLARQLGGARADFTPQYGYTIALDLSFLNSLPPLAAMFVVLHECGHTGLPMGVGMKSPHQESNADCYAARIMRSEGYLTTNSAFDETMQSVRAVSASHMVSQQRISRILHQCLGF